MRITETVTTATNMIVVLSCWLIGTFPVRALAQGSKAAECRVLGLIPFTVHEDAIDQRRENDLASEPTDLDLERYATWKTDYTVRSGFAAMAAAQLAVDHFNARDDVVVPELAQMRINNSCPVTLSLSVADSASSAKVAVRNVLERIRGVGFAGGTVDTSICAILGPGTQHAASEVSAVAKALEIPQLLYSVVSDQLTGVGSTAVATSPSTTARAVALVDFLQRPSRPRDYLFIVNVGRRPGVHDGMSGNELAAEILRANEVLPEGTRLRGVEFSQISWIEPMRHPENVTLTQQAADQLVQVKDSGIKTILLVVSDPRELAVLAAALMQSGLLSTEYLFILDVGAVHHPETQTLDRVFGSLPIHSALAHLLSGAMVFDAMDNFRTFSTSASASTSSAGTGTTGNNRSSGGGGAMGSDNGDAFWGAWHEQNESLVTALNRMKPNSAANYTAPPDYFQTTPPMYYASYVYDAVMSVGFGACAWMEQHNSTVLKQQGEDYADRYGPPIHERGGAGGPPDGGYGGPPPPPDNGNQDGGDGNGTTRPPPHNEAPPPDKGGGRGQADGAGPIDKTKTQTQNGGNNTSGRSGDGRPPPPDGGGYDPEDGQDRGGRPAPGERDADSGNGGPKVPPPNDGNFTDYRNGPTLEPPTAELPSTAPSTFSSSSALPPGITSWVPSDPPTADNSNSRSNATSTQPALYLASGSPKSSLGSLPGGNAVTKLPSDRSSDAPSTSNASPVPIVGPSLPPSSSSSSAVLSPSSSPSRARASGVRTSAPTTWSPTWLRSGSPTRPSHPSAESLRESLPPGQGKNNTPQPPPDTGGGEPRPKNGRGPPPQGSQNPPGRDPPEVEPPEGGPPEGGPPPKKGAPGGGSQGEAGDGQRSDRTRRLQKRLPHKHGHEPVLQHSPEGPRDDREMSDVALVAIIEKIYFHGASGTVSFQSYGSKARGVESASIGLYNIRPSPESYGSSSGAYIYEAVLTELWTNLTWTPWDDESFIYRDGTQTMPLETREIVNENYLSGWVRAVGLTLMGVAWFLALGCMIFVWITRRDALVLRSQPVFMQLLCVGSVIISASIFTLSWDEGAGWSDGQLDAACMLLPWFFFVGQVVTFMALFTKLWRVDKVLQFRRGVKVTIANVIWPLFLLLVLTLVILIVWTAVDPLMWERFLVSNIPAESYGECTNDHFWAFFGPLMGLIVFAEGLTAFFALKTADVPEEFNDTASVMYAIVTQLEAWIIGVPILAVLGKSSVDGTYFGRVLLIWIFSVSGVLLVVLPKIIRAVRMRRNPDLRNSSKARVNVTGVYVPTSHQSYTQNLRNSSSIPSASNGSLPESPSHQTPNSPPHSDTLQETNSGMQLELREG